MKRLLQIIVLAALALLPVSAGNVAERKMDVKSWLSEPGVKLVAIDFYATWCDACNDPKNIAIWEMLKEKYRDKGLRVAVVSVMPKADAGGCKMPPMDSDYYVCDRNGKIQETWGANDLPQAFLVNWKGTWLVQNEPSVQSVAKAVESYFKTEIRLGVIEPETEGDVKIKAAELDRIKRLVSGELNKQAKFDVVMSAEEMKATIKEQAKWGNSKYFKGCSLGQPLSPNTHLKIIVGQDGKKKYLTLAMQSVEKGCVVGSAEIEVSKDNWELAVAQAVNRLLSGIIDAGEKSSFGGGDEEPVAKKEVPKKKEVDTAEKEIKEEPVVMTETGGGSEDIVVNIDSDPAGAKVFFNKAMICAKTPCKTEIASGKAVFEFRPPNDKYEGVSVTVTIKRGMKPVMGRLAAKFGTLDVTSDPSGAEVKLDDAAIGNTPVTGYEIGEGRHKVEVGGSLYYKQGKEFGVNRGEKKSYDFKLIAKQGNLKVKAKTKGGEPLEGKVFVDDKEIGYTGKAYAVNIGRHKVKVVTDKGEDEKDVEIKEGKEELLQFELEEGGGKYVKGSAKIIWVTSKVKKLNGLKFSKSEVTVKQFEACVNAGKCKKENYHDKSENSNCNWGYDDRGDHPMNCVDWYGAEAFCKWAGGRLPTEEEWEAEASNGGTRKYPWGDELLSCNYAIWSQGGNGCGKNSTWPVCSKEAGNSVSGLCDMSGNLWEWTSSFWSSSNTNTRVFRGGSWSYNNPEYFQASNRYYNDPSHWLYNIGLRCAQ